VAPPVPPAPPAAPPAALIDFAAALSALKASRPAKTSAAPTPAPETFEPSEPVTFSSIAGQTALETTAPPGVVEVVDEVLPEEPEVVEAESLLYVQTGLAAEDEDIEVEAEPEPEPEPEALLELEPVVEPEPEVEPEPLAESEPTPVSLAEPEPEPVPQVEPEPEWEEIAAPLPPVRPHGHELAAVVSNFETELPAGPWDQAAAESRRVELRRHLVFAINEERFAVNLDNLVEIDNMPTWTGIPGLPQTVRGLINLRGEIVSLLELRAILGLPHPEIPKKGKIFVASTADRQTVSAFAVDEIDGIFGFDEARLTPIPSPVAGITSTVEDGGRLIRILDIGSVLTDVEKTFSLDQVWI
jgi:chemotaxis signal transduction protein